MSEEIVRRILTSKKKVLFESTEVSADPPTVETEGTDVLEESLVYELGDTINNLGYLWQVKAIKGNYVLFYAPKKSGDKYAVATGMKEVGNRQTTWRNEKFFSSPRDAYKYLLTKAGKLTVENESQFGHEFVGESAEEIPEEKTCECGSTNIIVENGEEICDECGRKYKPMKELSEPLVPEKIKEAEKYTRKEILIAALRYWNAGKYEKAMNVCKKYGVPERDFIQLLIHSYRESEEVEGEEIEESSVIKPEDEDKLGSNIIRAIQKPISTQEKPEISETIPESKNMLKESTYLMLDYNKLKNRMRAKGYSEDEYLEFLYDVYELEDGEDFQVGNDPLELGFRKVDAKVQRLKRELCK